MGHSQLKLVSSNTFAVFFLPSLLFPIGKICFRSIRSKCCVPESQPWLLTGHTNKRLHVYSDPNLHSFPVIQKETLKPASEKSLDWLKMIKNRMSICPWESEGFP